MDAFMQYVNEHFLRKITMGKSGADVYELDNSRIAKHIQCTALAADVLWDSYKREFQFYSVFSAAEFTFIPKIYHCCQSDDEIQVIMEKYRPLERHKLDSTVLKKIMAVLAQVHSLPVPDFLPQVNTEPFRLNQEDISQYLLGWQSVIEEHGQEFSKDDLSRIAENINAVNSEFHSSKRSVCHGDFHFENLLADDNGNIIVCDWQNVNLGHVSGDISFLLSRLSADGCEIDKDKAIQIYCDVSNANVTPDEIAIQMSLANLNTSFMFWHNYLHGSSAERIHSIYDKMVDDMNFLMRVDAEAT